MKFAFPMPNQVQLKAMTQPWELNVTGADQTRLAKRADELGYDMIVISEHHIIPKENVELSGPHYFNATAAQGYLAGATTRIRINSAVTILPLQNPIVLAKGLSTIDWLSSGRITVTFGVGWLEKEFEILRVPFRERGRMADD
jgi:alkanesulfonate monooxygenase SsuD/methylene tetrahydromethanopterin reductase-like flavin-dependent oxidoreductase (luciferase family)